VPGGAAAALVPTHPNAEDGACSSPSRRRRRASGPAGRHFLLCPVGDEGELPHHLQGTITEVTVT
jgi:hypothetical protein